VTYSIQILRDATILLNGARLGFSTVRRILSQADPAVDAVIYDREDREAEVPPVAQELIHLIAALQLPVGFRPPGPAGTLRVGGTEIELPVPSPAVQELAESLPRVFPVEAAGQRLVVVAPPLSQTGPVDSLANELPYLWPLAGTALQGHEVIVTPKFDAIEGADAVIVDSAVLQLPLPGWVELAASRGKPHVRVHLFLREQNSLAEVVPSRYPPYYHQAEPDGEASFAHCLLTVMGRGSSVSIEPGAPLPDLAALTADPVDLDWIAGLRFVGAALDPAAVIEALVECAQGSGGRWKFRARRIPGRGEGEPEFTCERTGHALRITRL
jgi:hypothetical protein